MREYIAKVISLEDPEERQRAQVRVFEKFPEGTVDDADLPWATYKLPVGAGFNEGLFIPAKVGEHVWVDFPFRYDGGSEDTRKPRITGSVHMSPQGLPNVPHDAFGGPLGLDDQHHAPEVENEDGELEPDPDYEETQDSDHTRAAVFTKEGWTFRLQNGAWTATHRKSKARLEFSESGHFDLYTPQNGFVRALGKLKLIGGELLLKATKTFQMDLPALEQKIKDWRLEAQNVEIRSTGAAKIIAKAVQIATDGDMILSGSGKRESSFSGSDLTKIGVGDDPIAWGAKLHATGADLAEIALYTDGLFKIHNQASSLKGDVVDALIVSHLNTLNALSWFLDEYVKHFHTATGPAAPTTPPTTAGAVNGVLSSPGEFNGVGQIKITEALNKINTAKLKLEALMK